MELQQFGGRGSKSATAKGTGGAVVANGSQVDMTEFEANKRIESYEKQYDPYARGQVSKYEASLLYKNVKEGNIKALPETTSLLYDEAKAEIRFSSERYMRDSRYYDRINHTTTALMNNDYKSAQVFINALEEDLIKRSGKKSRYYKYNTEAQNLFKS